MTKLINSSDLLKRIARNQYKLHNTIKEWQTVIVLLLFLKLSAMAFSVFAGYEYLRNFFFELLNSKFLSITFAAIVLILIEFLTMYFLSKFFKFGLRLKLKSSILPLFGAVIFFGVSFHLSTNGLAIRQSSKADNTEVLTANYQDKTLHINLLYDSKIDNVKEMISTVKSNPQGWNKGKRTILLSEQLKQIDKYYTDIQGLNSTRKQGLTELKKEYQDQILQNTRNTTNEANKYYKIVSFVMVIILLINGLLMFFYSKIWHDENKEQATNEAINSLSSDIETKATNLITNRITDVFNLFFSAMAVQFEDNKPRLTTSENKPITIGFQAKKNNSEPSTPINENKPYARNNARSSTPVNHGFGTCPNCEKTFTKNSYNHKYCVELCRIEFAEKKTGKNYERYKKLHK